MSWVIQVYATLVENGLLTSENIPEQYRAEVEALRGEANSDSEKG